jgi:hypothetical protein
MLVFIISPMQARHTLGCCEGTISSVAGKEHDYRILLYRMPMNTSEHPARITESRGSSPGFVGWGREGFVVDGAAGVAGGDRVVPVVVVAFVKGADGAVGVSVVAGRADGFGEGGPEGGLFEFEAAGKVKLNCPSPVPEDPHCPI